MEQWEVVERCVLLTVCAGLAAFGVWWGVERDVWGVLIALTPVISWILWQTFFEDRLGTSEPVSGSERLAYLAILWTRRIVLGGLALLLSVAAAMSLADDDFLLSIVLAFFALFVTWVAWFGAGRSRSITDDVSVHRERQRRYR
jgi:hypothetical protein